MSDDTIGAANGGGAGSETPPLSEMNSDGVMMLDSFGNDVMVRGLQAVLPSTNKATSIVPSQGTPLSQCPTNLDLTTRVGKALALKASSPGQLALDERGVLKMICTAFIITPDMVTDADTGECKEFARVSLFNAHGKHFRTTAAHAPFRLKAMLEIFSTQEWAEGIPIIIEERKSKRGTKYHDINIDTEGM